MAACTHGLLGSALLLGSLGFWAGFFAVPVNALIQHRPPEKNKGGIIAAANLLSFVGIALSAGVYYVFTAFIHLNPRGVILAASLITAAGTVYVLILLPEWFGRLILFFVTHTIYRVKVIGRENFPERTGALLVCNHMSFVDAALLIASTDRPIRFLMYQGIYDNPIVKPFASMMKAIPISERTSPARDDPLAAHRKRRACARMRSSASSPKARSRAPASCCPSAAALSAL